MRENPLSLIERKQFGIEYLLLFCISKQPFTLLIIQGPKTGFLVLWRKTQRLDEGLDIKITDSASLQTPFKNQN